MEYWICGAWPDLSLEPAGLQGGRPKVGPLPLGAGRRVPLHGLPGTSSKARTGIFTTGCCRAVAPVRPGGLPRLVFWIRS